MGFEISAMCSVHSVPMSGGRQVPKQRPVRTSLVAGFSRHPHSRTAAGSKTPKFQNSHLPQPDALEPWFRAVIGLGTRSVVGVCLVASWVVGGGWWMTLVDRGGGGPAISDGYQPRSG